MTWKHSTESDLAVIAPKQFSVEVLNVRRVPPLPIVYMSSVCILVYWPPIVYGIFPPSALEQTLKFCRRCTFWSSKKVCWPPCFYLNMYWIIFIEYAAIGWTANSLTNSIVCPDVTLTTLKPHHCWTDNLNFSYEDCFVCSLHCLNSHSSFKDRIRKKSPTGKSTRGPQDSGQVAPKDLLLHGAYNSYPHIRPQKFSMEFSKNTPHHTLIILLVLIPTHL